MNKQRVHRCIVSLLALGVLLTLAVDSRVDAARRARGKASAQEASHRIGENNVLQPDGQVSQEAGAENREEAPREMRGLVGPGKPGSGEKNTARTTYEEFLKKFEATEQALRELKAQSRQDHTGVSMRNESAAELRYWETQLNVLYQSIMEQLTEEEAAVFAVSQQDWRKQRDANAAKAALDSPGNSKDNTAYRSDQAESTRKRAYELLKKYKDCLE